VVREELADCILVNGPHPYPPLGGAHRLRLRNEDVEARIAEVRAWFAARGRDEFTWWVGPSATPSDLGARLEQAGAVPFPDEPVVTAMVLTERPPAVAGVEVRLVETFEDYATAQEIGWKSGSFTEAQVEAGRAQLEERWRDYQEWPDGLVYLASLDGRPVARGSLILCPFGGFLSGAGTLEHARGAGAFRALVRARWDAAECRGTPALVVGAGAMSRPILARLGFRTVAETQVLLDRSVQG
jgi:hypothetical protein